MSVGGSGRGSDRIEVVLVATTVAGDEAAIALAEAVVARRLAACAKRRSVSSTYRWAGAVERADEVVVEMVTTASRVDELVSFVTSHHPYELPELISWPVAASAAYAEWVEVETRAGS